jgi:hypothetical protein
MAHATRVIRPSPFRKASLDVSKNILETSDENGDNSFTGSTHDRVRNRDRPHERTMPSATGHDPSHLDLHRRPSHVRVTSDTRTFPGRPNHW